MKKDNNLIELIGIYPNFFVMGRMWHKVNFYVEFEFRVLLLLDWLLNQG